MKKINLFILVLLLCNSCDKYDESSYNYTVSVNKSEFELGEKIKIDLQGGMEKSLIYPVLAKFNSNGDLTEHIDIFDIHNSPAQYDDCCISEGTGGYSSSWIDDGLICNCDINGVIVHAPDSSLESLRAEGLEFA